MKILEIRKVGGSAMYRTVKDIIKLNGFERTRVVAGEKGMQNIVGGATLMEVPDILPYLENNTLLLTTLFPISGDQEKLDNFIPQLHERGIAGICIKPMRYIDRISNKMIEQANRLDFPIIELPQDANLSTMANLILSLSLNDNIAKLQFRDGMHNTLTKLLLNGASIEKLVENLSCLIKKNVFLLDKSLNAICIAVINPGETSSAAIYTGTQADEMLQDSKNLMNEYITHPVKAGKNIFGYIFVPDCPESLEEKEDLKRALEQSAMLFATLFFKNDAVYQNQRNFRDVFIRDLLQGKISSNIEIDNKMKAFGLTVRFPQYIVCLCLFTDDEIFKKKVYNHIINHKFIEKHLENHTMTSVKELNVTYFNDALVIMTDGDGKHMHELYGYVLDKLKKQFKNAAKFGIGISNSVNGFDMLDTAYKQAVSAVKTGDILYKESFVSLYSDNRLFDLIAQIQDHEVLKQFVRSKLGAVIDNDLVAGSDLMGMLQILIQENFNYKKAAESSYLHYNTVRYRIHKLNQLGVSFEGGQNLCEIVLAFNSYTWLKAINKL